MKRVTEMAEQPESQRIEITDGERTVTSAVVTSPEDEPEIVRAMLHAEAGQLPTGSRSRLVDAVVEVATASDGQRLEATVPLGDSESLHRLQEQCDDVTSRAVGSTALVDAVLPDTPHRTSSPSSPPASAINPTADTATQDS